MDQLGSGINEVEAALCQQAFLCCLYTDDVYKQWNNIKSSLGFVAEREFVKFLVEYIITHKTDVEIFIHGITTNFSADWFVHHITATDSRLPSTEAILSGDAMLLMMYGVEVYSKWRKIKCFLNFTNEAAFIQWVIQFYQNANCDPSNGDSNPKQCDNDVTVNNINNLQMVKSVKPQYEHRPRMHSIKFSCKVCGYVSHNKVTALNHMSKHSKNKLIRIGQSSAPKKDDEIMSRATGLSSLKQAVSVKVEGLHCKLCLRYFINNQHLTNHVVKIHLKNMALGGTDSSYRPSTIFICDGCNYSTSNKSDLIIHWKFAHPQKVRYKCCHCGSRYTSLSDLRAHQCILKMVRPSCNMCNKVYSSWIELHQHQLEIHKTANDKNNVRTDLRLGNKLPKMKRMHICNECGKVFRLESHLLKHALIFHKMRKRKDTEVLERCRDVLESPRKNTDFTCDLCHRQFAQAKYLTEHKINAHKLYTCPVCKFIAKNAYFLRKHKEDKHFPPYTCTKCADIFLSNTLLKKHVWEKHGAYKCQICHMRFITKRMRLQHRISKHPNPKEKEYKCSHCNEKFPIKSDLSIHLAEKHTAAFVCDTCGKEFLSLGQLNRHQISHTAGSIMCSQCSAMFKHHDGLARHEKIVHDKLKLHQCEICADKFGTS